MGNIVGGGAFDAPYVDLFIVGRIAEKFIKSGERMSGIHIDKYVVMPNHIHMILFVDTDSCGTSKAPSPTNAIIPHFVSTFKRFCHKEAGFVFFQRSYHDHVIRGEKDYLKIWEYIDNNPARWQEDCFYQGGL